MPHGARTLAAAALGAAIILISEAAAPWGAARSDTTPPVVTLSAPDGGELFDPQTTQSVTWSATDDVGVTSIDIDFSDDGGATFKPVARGEANDGTFSWFVPNLPGTQSRIRVTAWDAAGNAGADTSGADFTIDALTGGFVSTTLRDFRLPGTQPFQGSVLSDPSASCVFCHADYDPAVEPYHNWSGSMMAQAARDPLFYACLAVAEQDVPSVGDLCIRCHSPGGWQEGRSVDTSGGMLTAKDRQGVQCDFCHHVVDPFYQPGVSPPEDVDVLAALDALPVAYGNGQFVTDPDPSIRRGPFADAAAPHPFLASDIHRRSDICGTCHDVSNPVYVQGSSWQEYVLDTLDVAHPDADPRDMFPIERTYSEWSRSEYAATGVYAPQFAGDKPDGIVSTCQDCHMHDVTGKGCSQGSAPVRTNLPLHDFTGGNTFAPDIIPAFFPGEVDTAALQDAKARATAMLQMAATLDAVAGWSGSAPTVTVTVTNETGHKLPSGYPEGRRMWLNVRAWDAGDALVYQSGAYDAASGVLTEDADLTVYETRPGISNRLSLATGLTAAPSFHFALNDTIWFDNRIPPRGFTNAAFDSIQAAPVGASYADGQYWDTAVYQLPLDADHAEVTLYYQTTSKEYVEFLRDENVTNSIGDDLYAAWVGQGRAAPVAMQTDTLSVLVPTTVSAGPGTTAPVRTQLLNASPNPVPSATRIRYALAASGPVTIAVYDVEGRRVRTLVDGKRAAGLHQAIWDGRDGGGRRVSAGVYFYRMETPELSARKKLVVVR